MIVPAGFDRFSDALRAGAEVFHNLKKILSSRSLSTGVGDEGGFAPNLSSNEEAITVIMEAIKAAGYRAGKDVYLALDTAASEIYKDGTYNLEAEGKNPFLLDSKEPDWSLFQGFLNSEVRYTSLKKSFPEEAAKLFAAAESNAKWRYESYKRMAAMEYTAKQIST